MDYNRIYTSLIGNARINENERIILKKENKEYYERHHIIPKCLGGSDANYNLIFLTAREHFLAHILLCKIYSYEPQNIRYKLSSALWRMKDKPNLEAKPRITSSRMFELARKEYIKNHPMKDEDIKKKASLNKRFSGFIRKEDAPPKPPKETFICACGCGTEGVRNNRKNQIYIHGHAHQAINYEKVSKSLSKTLSEMSEEDMKKRMSNSLRSCDHVERGKSISKSKKGKKTNQNQIMGERLAGMSDSEFETYLSTLKAQNVKTRYINLRRKYIHALERNEHI